MTRATGRGADRTVASAARTVAAAAFRCGVASLVGVVVSAGAAPQEEPPKIPTGTPADPLEAAERSIERGLAFLREDQNRDGSFGRFESARPYEVYLDTVASLRGFGVATTALAVAALREVGSQDAADRSSLERGIRAMLAAEPTARASGHTFYDTWSHLYLVETLAGVVLDARLEPFREAAREVLAREVALLARIQAADGGWGYYDFEFTGSHPSGYESASFVTAAALLALVDAKAAGVEFPQDRLRSALGCLERYRLGTGAYIYGTYAERRPGVLFNRT